MTLISKSPSKISICFQEKQQLVITQYENEKTDNRQLLDELRQENKELKSENKNLHEDKKNVNLNFFR